MENRFKKTIVDASTNTSTVVDMTQEEIDEILRQDTKQKDFEAAKEAEMQRIANLKASAKAKLISGEPLTEEEAEVITL